MHDADAVMPAKDGQMSVFVCLRGHDIRARYADTTPR